MPKRLIRLTVNGREHEVAVEPWWTLLYVVREELGLTGTKEGCGTGDCGACSMLVDDRLITSCILLAVEADGAQVVTIEGLSRDGQLHPIQRAFAEEGAIQCGYCTPGMVMASYDLLRRCPRPTLEDLRQALAGNLCRCTGYAKIYQAVLKAAELMEAYGP
jgi:carbon-monoxide dehydrogenase small subunit